MSVGCLEATVTLLVCYPYKITEVPELHQYKFPDDLRSSHPDEADITSLSIIVALFFFFNILTTFGKVSSKLLLKF